MSNNNNNRATNTTDADKMKKEWRKAVRVFENNLQQICCLYCFPNNNDLFSSNYVGLEHRYNTLVTINHATEC